MGYLPFCSSAPETKSAQHLLTDLIWNLCCILVTVCEVCIKKCQIPPLCAFYCVNILLQ